jgi:hypothetical protein
LIRWLGDGSAAVNQNCYPKNLVRLIYLIELKFTSSAGYKSASPDEIDATIAAHREEGGNWSLNYIEPLLKTVIHQLFFSMVEIANQNPEKEWEL